MNCTRTRMTIQVYTYHLHTIDDFNRILYWHTHKQNRKIGLLSILNALLFCQCKDVFLGFSISYNDTKRYSQILFYLQKCIDKNMIVYNMVYRYEEQVTTYLQENKRQIMLQRTEMLCCFKKDIKHI